MFVCVLQCIRSAAAGGCCVCPSIYMVWPRPGSMQPAERPLLVRRAAAAVSSAAACRPRMRLAWLVCHCVPDVTETRGAGGIQLAGPEAADCRRHHRHRPPPRRPRLYCRRRRRPDRRGRRSGAARQSAQVSRQLTAAASCCCFCR